MLDWIEGDVGMLIQKRPHVSIACEPPPDVDSRSSDYAKLAGSQWLISLIVKRYKIPHDQMHATKDTDGNRFGNMWVRNFDQALSSVVPKWVDLDVKM